MKQTTNYKLKKPDYTDVADIADINSNMDILDKELKEHKHNVSSITGLGDSATKNVATTVASGNINPVTSGAVYSAISNIKTNNRTHIVISTYDTKNPLKSNADYICNSVNASSILKTALSSINNGGKIELLDGTYNLSYQDTELEISKSITIEGQGFNTVIKQPVDADAGEAKAIFNITAQNVNIKNMMLSDADISSPVSMINQSAQGTIYDSIFFIFNSSESSVDDSCVEGTGNCNFTRIQNCRVYKGFKNDDKVMFDYSSCTNFSGVIGGNISSGYGNISVRFNNEGHKNNTAIYGHSNIDIDF